ncbi:MAG: zinc ABC transporter substrate-binding protein [Hyphomicrobiales bacterium]
MSLPRSAKFLLATTLLATLPSAAFAEPKVVVSLKPIHSLVAAVMEGVGTPDLIVTGNESPHNFSLKPSQASVLSKADLIFYVAPDLEQFLTKPLETIAAKAESVALIDAEGIVKLPYREGATFEEHDHDHGHGGEEKHDDHDKHEDHAKKDDHDDHDDHDKHDDHAKKDDHDDHDDHDKHKDHDDHADGAVDPHIFLDPQNAKAMVSKISEELIHHDAANAATYKANASNMQAELDGLLKDIAARMDKIKEPRFIVFHDAYHYFEARFDVEATGSITLSPENAPGVARVKEIRASVQDMKAGCVFTEPQFPSKLVDTVTEGTSAKTATLDPLGATLDEGPKLYSKLINNMAAAFEGCLSKAG